MKTIQEKEPNETDHNLEQIQKTHLKHTNKNQLSRKQSINTNNEHCNHPKVTPLTTHKTHKPTLHKRKTTLTKRKNNGKSLAQKYIWNKRSTSPKHRKHQNNDKAALYSFNLKRKTLQS